MTNVHNLAQAAVHHSLLRDELLRRYPSLIDDDEALAGTLEGLSSLEDEIKAVAYSVDDDAVLVAGIDERVTELKIRAQRISDRIEAKRAAILHAMTEGGVKKIELPIATISPRQNPQTVTITDEAAIPSDYLIFPDAPPARPDKRAIAADLKAGKVIAGCALSNGSTSLNWRTK